MKSLGPQTQTWLADELLERLSTIEGADIAWLFELCPEHATDSVARPEYLTLSHPHSFAIINRLTVSQPNILTTATLENLISEILSNRFPEKETVWGGLVSTLHHRDPSRALQVLAELSDPSALGHLDSGGKTQRLTQIAQLRGQFLGGFSLFELIRVYGDEGLASVDLPQPLDDLRLLTTTIPSMGHAHWFETFCTAAERYHSLEPALLRVGVSHEQIAILARFHRVARSLPHRLPILWRVWIIYLQQWRWDELYSLFREWQALTDQRPVEASLVDYFLEHQATIRMDLPIRWEQLRASWE